VLDITSIGGVEIVEVDVERALSESGLPDLVYALNPYLGCYHGCLYCYARLYTRVKEVSERWGRVVYVKRNLVEVLQREVKRVRRGVVGVGTITDPYQPIEAVYKLTRRSLEVLLRAGFPVSIQTKSSLVLRDLDLLKAFRDLVDVGLTITSTDDSMRPFEPNASPPQARIYALKKLAEAGIKTWIFYGPIVPSVNDDPRNIRELVQLAKETRSVLYYDRLRVKPFMWSSPMSRYAKAALNYPWRSLFEYIERTCREYGVICKEGLGDAPQEPSKSLDYFFKQQ